MIEDSEDIDDGEAAEEALNNPKTLTDKIVAHAAEPIALGLLLADAVYVYYKDHHPDTALSDASEVVALSVEPTMDAQVLARGEEIIRIHSEISNAMKYEQCVRAYKPLNGCGAMLGAEFESQVSRCEGVSTTSQLLHCCREFSEKLHQCMSEVKVDAKN